MAIYDYNTNASQIGNQHFIQPQTFARQSILANSRKLVEKGKYQEAFEQLKDCAGDINLINLKAVLLLRLHQPVAAANLLRSHVWDLVTFTLKPDVPVHIQLNFATALLLSGHVAGSLEIIQANVDTENAQAAELLADIRSWEKSLTVFHWLDWKACGIEHIKGEFPTTMDQLGRFGWEPESQTIPRDVLGHAASESRHSHDLAC